MPVYLEKDFREMLFSKCYHLCGGLAEIGKGMGYEKKPGLNGPIRNMWLGVVAVPGKRVEALATLVSISSQEILAHRVSKEQNLVSEDWGPTYERYLRTSNAVPT